ncbi:MAG TPA: FAD-dependent thymidylate synthase [Candidatus Saccharimonadia bacterium]|nr:FAD-dependent thymidylate synthase [Candidatus Saccharimonadia bacterium]
MAYAAKILLDSISPQGVRLITFEVTFPRFILAEFNTHRAFSRNTASSRAIPAKKIWERTEAEPFVPSYWGKNQKGMQADEELSPAEQTEAERLWRNALAAALDHAKQLAELGVHKQLTNRILEPFMWHTALVTATEWDNFFALRAHPAAQPEIQTIARMMKELYDTNQPQLLQEGQWHLPLIRPEEFGEADLETLKQVSSGRCARVSYLTHDGVRDLEADVRLHNQLREGGHMSPFEHVARPMTAAEYAQTPFLGNFRGWHQYRKDLPHESNYAEAQAVAQPEVTV